jgi:Winged helix DNA-binding domain
VLRSDDQWLLPVARGWIKWRCNRREAEALNPLGKSGRQAFSSSRSLPCSATARSHHELATQSGLMPDRLSRRQLNRAILARQLLLQRVDLPAVEVAEHLVGLQAQAPLAPYVALWSRLSSFDPVVVGNAVAAGSLVRTHAMRATVHLFSRRDALSLRALMQPMLATRFRSSPIPKQVPGLDVAAVCRHARDLATDTPLSRVELGRHLGLRFPGYPTDALAYTVTYLEPMVQVPPRGMWGRNGPVRWQTFQGWIGTDADQPARVDDVVVRYLAAFGPASVPDVRVWSGLPALREVVDRLRPRLRIFHDHDGRELYDLPDAPRPDPDTPAPIRFLPEYDNLLLSHADRSRLIPDRRPVPLPPGEGARTGTVLIDGEFRATWQLATDQGTPTLTVHATPRLAVGELEAAHKEGQNLLAFLLSRQETTSAAIVRILPG